jgi:hypothetical protein
MIGGTAIFGFGLWMWLYALLRDIANGQEVIDRAELIVFMMWVAPAIVVVVGCYIQSIRRKQWPVILVLIGGVGVLPFVAENAWFIFAYTGNAWGLRVVYTDLITVVVTMLISILNVAFDETPAAKIPTVA